MTKRKLKPFVVPALYGLTAVIFVFSEMTLEAFCNAYLLQRYSKRAFKDWEFIKKVDRSIVTMLSENGTTISDADANNYYGSDIPQIIKIRKIC